jgi:uncharacterized protein YegJ (DUF2314 family)
MSRPGRPFPPWHVCLTLGVGLFMLGRGVQDVAAGTVTGWTWFRLAGAGFLAWSGIGEWRKFQRHTQRAVPPPLPPLVQGGPEGGTEEGAPQPMRSLVFLLSEPREAPPKGAWTEHMARALGVSLDPEDKESGGFLLPMPHPGLSAQGDDCFALLLPDAGMFWILNVKRPYVDDPESWAKQTSDGRLCEVLATHRAWISVDLVTWLGGEYDDAKCYALIGRALAVLAGPDVLAVLSPELSRCNEWDPSLLEKLAGGEPLAIFQSPTFAPVIHVNNDDEQMEAAVAEARGRWPEFVALFRNRRAGEDKPFLVKAPFNDAGGTEYMWMAVSRIEGDTIHGTLENSPHHLETYFDGQAVSISTAELNDFLCPDGNGLPLGAWTIRVLESKMKRAS